MILFAADNHYEARPGLAQFEKLRDRYEIEFHEDDWSCFDEPNLKARYAFIALNLISGTGTAPMPSAAAEANVKAYMEAGGDLLLLHGASAAFWQWDWWRPLVGFRWVRGDDSDGFEASSHPTRPYRIERAKARHPLVAALREMDLPEDEIYVDLEQTCPAETLMTTTTDEGTFVQCYACVTPWDGRVLGYLPGHRSEVAAGDGTIANISVLMDDLLALSS